MKTRMIGAAASTLAVMLLGVVASAEPPSDAQHGHRGRPDLQAHRAEALQKYDLNGDGQLDRSERATLQADVLAGRVDPPGPMFAADSPARKALDTRRLEILAKYDANADGKLDDAEVAALKANILAGKVEPFGPRGGHGKGGHRGHHPDGAKCGGSSSQGEQSATQP